MSRLLATGPGKASATAASTSRFRASAVHRRTEEPMSSTMQVQEWRGAKAIDANGDKVGTIDEVYLDQGSEQPEWITVSTGLFGTRTTFVPIGGGELTDGEVRLAYTKDQIKDAPNIDADGALSREEEQRLYQHYGRSDYGDFEAGGSNT